MAGSDRLISEKALELVIQFFRYHELSIRRLIKINEAFREMCVDFAEAQTALLASSTTGDQAQEDQRLEWAEIVERLHADVADALRVYEANMPHVRR